MRRAAAGPAPSEQSWVIREQIETCGLDAVVTSAVPLTAEQAARMRRLLARALGREARVKTRVDEQLIGGMIVSVGATRIDTSIRGRLAGMRNATREGG